ncbi:hypothetical protein BC830DRAFT_517774 [Chytriomyces sp. MP71]|nr:hypothetical protein BC830DRAFT_517774 [Chytriomyces sp. MP71]
MKRDSAAVRVGASENGWSASSTELVGMGTPINNNHVLQIRSLHYWEVPRGERLVVGTSKTNLTKTNLPLPTHPHEAKESAHREMDQRRLSESINMPRVLLHLDAKAAPVTVSSRPPAATFAKPKKFVCANCETSIASSWRRSATHGPDQWLCNSCSVYYRMKGVQRPKDLRRDVVDKRLPTGASYKKVPMKRKRADPTDDGLTFRPGGAIAREAKRIAVERQHHQHGYEDYRA